MDKEQFLKELEKCLLTLSTDERKAAIKYYDEYFEDAGKENEQSIINEIGPAQKLADEILKEHSQKNNENNTKSSVNNNRNTLFWFLIFTLTIFGLPVIFPLVMSLFGVCIGFLFSGVALFIAGIAVSTAGIVTIFTSLGVGVFMAGIGFILTALGILISILIFHVLVKIIPSCIRGIVSIFQKALNLGGVK